MKDVIYSVLLGMLFLFLNGCKKDDENAIIDDSFSSRQEILREVGVNVIAATYEDMSKESASLAELVNIFSTSVTDENLTNCRNKWKDVRNAWEQTEGFLFGPVATNNIDPRIDSWPINHQDLESILATNIELNQQYVNGLQESLKGFHPLEYLLFGNNGTKQAADFTPRELLFINALSQNLQELCENIANEWNTAQNNSYYFTLINAGAGSNIYISQKAAFLEIANALVGICDEVANGKINEPFTLANPALEESPYSSNSVTDFKNNIKGVQNVYIGKYKNDGKGIEDFVRKYNLSLDGKLKLEINEALLALDAINVPFGEAIFSQATQVEQTIVKINALKSTIEEELIPLIQLHIK
jgi:predicted lipoprotein